MSSFYALILIQTTDLTRFRWIKCARCAGSRRQDSILAHSPAKAARYVRHMFHFLEILLITNYTRFESPLRSPINVCLSSGTLTSRLSILYKWQAGVSHWLCDFYIHCRPIAVVVWPRKTINLSISFRMSLLSFLTKRIAAPIAIPQPTWLHNIDISRKWARNTNLPACL